MNACVMDEEGRKIFGYSINTLYGILSSSYII